MEEYIHELKIPKARIAVLIGKKGETKKELEESTKTNIEVDSKEGEVKIKGKDPVRLYSVKEMILAISRGFNPEVAKLLLKQDYVIEIISLNDFSDKKNQLIRVRGRVIGKRGKARATIESLTETHISVYGKTVSIVGEPDKVNLARKAIESLLKGSTHASVYKWLENNRRKMKQQEMMNF